jgi:hypothetical protein
MQDMKNSVAGILGALIGMILTVFGWYLIPALSEMLPITSLKAIFWTGLLSYWILSVIITPMLMIMGGKGSFKGVIKGFGFFLIGYIVSLISYYVAPPIIEALDSIWSSSVFTSLGWLAIYLIWILSMLVIPSYLVIKHNMEGNEE